MSSSHPRISFSNDFVDTNLLKQQQQKIRPSNNNNSEPSPPSDFEFSVSNYSMMSADELFSKGKLLPYKETGCSRSSKPVTLREELLAEEEEGGGMRNNKNKGSGSGLGLGSGRWREILGLRKAHVGSRKNKPDGPAERRLSVVYDNEEAHDSSSSSSSTKGWFTAAGDGNDGGSSRRDGKF